MNKIGSGLFAATLILGAGALQAQDMTIAVVGPMTGQYASFGEQLRRGAEQAVADINANGGVLGRKLKLEIGDDACDPRQAVAVANQLAGKKVAFIAGHFCSGSSIPASEVYAEEGILQISPGSTNPALTERGDKYRNVFRVCGRDDKQGVVAGTYLATAFKGKNIAILHDKSAYGKGVADETRKIFNKLEQTEKLYEAINQGDKDFTALVSKMKSASIDAIYFGGYHTEGGLLIRQAREQGLQAQLVVPDAMVTQEFWAISGPAGEGTLMTFPPDPRNFTAAKEVVAAFKKGGYDPEGYTLYTYAAVQAFAAAAEQAKSTKGDDLGKALKSRKFKTVLDEISFDAKGDVIGPEYVFYVWKNGSYREKES